MIRFEHFLEGGGDYQCKAIFFNAQLSSSIVFCLAIRQGEVDQAPIDCESISLFELIVLKICKNCTKNVSPNNGHSFIEKRENPLRQICPENAVKY